MSWFNVGFEAAESMSAPRLRRTNRNFWTKPEETAVVRFLSPAKDTFNFKRSFVKESKGQKYFTSPMVEPDPFVQAGYTLQSTFAWKILDRRILEFTDRNGEDQKVGPRILYLAVGHKDRKSLQAFEAQMLADYNEYLKEEGKKPVTLDQYNLTSFDIRMSKPPKGNWQFVAVRGGTPKALSKEDKKLVEENDFSLEEELKPLPMDEIKAVLNNVRRFTPAEESTEYSYDPEQTEDEPTFFGVK